MAMPRLSLRLVLIGAFVVQTCLAVGTVALITFNSRREDATNFAKQLQKEISVHMVQHLEQYLQQPHAINQLGQEAVTQSLLNVKDIRQASEFFLGKIRTFSVSYVGYVSSAGEFVGIERRDDGKLLVNIIQAQTGIGKLQVFDQNRRLLTVKDYEPRKEVWYAQALQAGKPVWSAIYRWDDKPEVVSISAVQPLFDPQGKRIGVIGSDLSLLQISAYLHEIKPSPNGRIFIVERSGLLVASSANYPVTVVINGKSQRLALIDSPDRTAQATGQFLVQRFGDFQQIKETAGLSFTSDQEQYIVNVTPYQDQRGLDWLVVVTMPESDFLARTHQNTRFTFGWWAVATLFALLIGWFIAHWLARPIRRLNRDTQQIAQEAEFDHVNCQIDRHVDSSWIAELSELAGSFMQMANRLQDILDKLHQQAYFDPLTGAGNHNLLRKRIQECLEQKQDFVLLYLDVDRFKSLQYAFGQQISEHLLLEVAHRIANCTSPEDTFARIGIDEFAVLFCALRDRQAAAIKAEELHQRINAPLTINDAVVSSTTSIGAVSSQLGGKSADTYLDAADTAMHYAKMWGKGRTVFYNAGMQTLVAERLQLESDLKQAIAESELHLNYQPIVNIRTGKVESLEALVRWRHPRRGMMPPAKFIAIAEETGLIVPLGRWVMETACAHIQRLHNNLPDKFPLSIAVNVSEVQLRYPRLLGEIDQLVQTIPAQSLKLELTETCLMENTEMMQSLLEELKERSIQLLIDDFGTGYSSLSYLQRLPVDTLKIDRSFITGIESHPRQLNIARAIITLAHSLGMDVVAEGLETVEQLAILQSLGCEYGQGFLFAKPLDQEDVIPFLREYKPQI